MKLMSHWWPGINMYKYISMSELYIGDKAQRGARWGKIQNNFQNIFYKKSRLWIILFVTLKNRQYKFKSTHINFETTLWYCVFSWQIHKTSLGSHLEYSDIRVFLEQLPTATTVYKSITTSNNNTIHLSKNHLIYSRKSNTEIFNPLWVYFSYDILCNTFNISNYGILCNIEVKLVNWTSVLLRGYKLKLYILGINIKLHHFLNCTIFQICRPCISWLWSVGCSKKWWIGPCKSY